MKKTICLIMLLLSASLIVSACGGGGGGGGGGTTPGGPGPTTPPDYGTQILNSQLTASPIVAYTQNIPSSDHTGLFDEVFPGSANIWTLEQDFTLLNGFDDQFAYALLPVIGSGPTATLFPSDQVYGELTYYTPIMGAADGVKVAAVSDGASVLSSLPSSTNIRPVITGAYAAFLNATSDSRLQQVITLPSGTTSFLKWHDAVSLDIGIFGGVNPAYSVVFRNLNGDVLQRFYGPFASTPNGFPVTNHSVPLPSYAGQTVVLSFEVHGSTFPLGQAYAIIDSVSITADAAGTIPRPGVLTNGNFETGDLTGWTTNTPAEVQNVTSGPRSVLGLTVTRSFYTAPNKLWGRWVDVYSNPTGNAVTQTITYQTALGSGGYGIIYNPVSYSTTTTGAPAKALTSWDSSFDFFSDGTRDVGLVFGNADVVDFISADGTGAVGSDLIDVSYIITVPAGGRVSLVNFVLMDGKDTGTTAGLTNLAPYDPLTYPDHRAAAIDTEAKNILNNFWTDPQYLRGMTQEQVASVVNFTP